VSICSFDLTDEASLGTDHFHLESGRIFGGRACQNLANIHHKLVSRAKHVIGNLSDCLQIANEDSQKNRPNKIQTSA
jgi:hypothetical protein